MTLGYATLPLPDNMKVGTVTDSNSVVSNTHGEVDQSGNFYTTTNPKPVAITSWGSSIATGQASVGTTATPIVGARAGRRSVTIIQEGAALVRLGTSGVTMSNGVPLPGLQYAAFSFEGGAAIYGIVASGTQTVSFVEYF